MYIVHVLLRIYAISSLFCYIIAVFLSIAAEDTMNKTNSKNVAQGYHAFPSILLFIIFSFYIIFSCQMKGKQCFALTSNGKQWITLIPVLLHFLDCSVSSHLLPSRFLLNSCLARENGSAVLQQISHLETLLICQRLYKRYITFRYLKT